MARMRKITRKDGSWVRVNLDHPDTKIEEDEEYIKVQYRDSSGRIQRWYVKKDDIKKDEEWEEGCIITTPCVKSMGLPDDCSELQAFRKLRDDYLIKKPKGKVFIEFYYRLSPYILERIYNNERYPNKVFKQIYYDWIIPITQKVHIQDYELAMSMAIFMIEELYKRYFTDFA